MRYIPVLLFFCLNVNAQVQPDAMGFIHPLITVQSGTNQSTAFNLKFYKGNDTFVVTSNTSGWYLGQDSGLSWAQPLVIVNASGTDIIINGGINAENCQYVKIIGWSSNSPYGFTFRNGGVTGSFHGMMKGIQISGCRFTGGTNGGVWFKEEAPGACDYYNYYGVVDTDPNHLKYKDIYQYLAQGNKPYDSIYFTHNKIDSCGGEGFYGMTTSYISNGVWRDPIPCLSNQRLAPTQAKNYHVDSNDVWTCGRTGIQLSQANAGGTNSMNGNKVHNIGYEYLVTHDPSALNQGKGISVGWHSQNMEVAYNTVDTSLNYNYDIEEAANVHHNIGDHVGKVKYNGILEINPQDIHALMGYANNTAINPMKINSNQMKATINGGKKFVVYGGNKFLSSGNDTCFNNGPVFIASTPFVTNSFCIKQDSVCHDTTVLVQHDTTEIVLVPVDYIPHDSVVTVADSIIQEKVKNKRYTRIRKYVTKTFTYYDTIPAHLDTIVCTLCASHDSTYVVCRYSAHVMLPMEQSNFAWNYKPEEIYGTKPRQ